MDTRKEQFTAAHAFLLIEGVSLMIGIAMAVTPNKTGSDYSIADHFFDDPSFLEQVAVYFLMTNALILILGLYFWTWNRIKGQDQ